jgi:signal transduction histidine kinase
MGGHGFWRSLSGTRGRLDLRSAMASVQEMGRAARHDLRDLRWAGEATSEGSRHAVAGPIVVEGRVWGAIGAGSRHEPLPPDTEQRLADFTELVATAIANAASRNELTSSRMRIVAAADQARRRIERDLHDGAQQHLVSLALRTRAAQAQVPPELGALAAELDDLAAETTDALNQLREIARGIHPAILAKGDLAAALRSLARRSPIPVELHVHTENRLPEHVDVSVYYLIAEALTNAAKYAGASLITITVEADAAGIADAVLRVTVHDDGVGGADYSRGTGLVGLKDRVEALGGRIRLDSPPGEGTSLRAELPLTDANRDVTSP